MNVELPLYGQASGIQLVDTVELNLKDFDESQIESAQIKALISNQLPLDGDIQLNLLDENSNLIESLLESTQTHIVKGSTVTASGELQSAGVFDDFISINQAKVNKLLTAKKIALTILLNTSKNSSGNPVDVKIKTDMAIDVKFGLKVKLKAKVNL
jgi:hypothetical protein